jgi:hypothetical protein
MRDQDWSSAALPEPAIRKEVRVLRRNHHDDLIAIVECDTDVLREANRLTDVFQPLLAAPQESGRCAVAGDVTPIVDSIRGALAERAECAQVDRLIPHVADVTARRGSDPRVRQSNERNQSEDQRIPNRAAHTTPR